MWIKKKMCTKFVVTFVHHCQNEAKQNKTGKKNYNMQANFHLYIRGGSPRQK